VGNWLDTWLAEYTANLKPSTKDAYQGRIENRIKPALEAVKLSELKPHMVQAFYNALIPELSPKSIQNIHGILHKACSVALELGYIRVNPTEARKLPRVEKPEIEPLDDKQIADFMEAVNGHRFEAFFIADMFLGLRQAEMLGLTWQDVDLKNGTIKMIKCGQ
jgi:integrase